MWAAQKWPTFSFQFRDVIHLLVPLARDKMPFEVTPFMLYLTRQINNTSTSGAPASGAISADSKPIADKAPQR